MIVVYLAGYHGSNSTSQCDVLQDCEDCDARALRRFEAIEMHRGGGLLGFVNAGARPASLFA